MGEKEKETETDITVDNLVDESKTDKDKVRKFIREEENRLRKEALEQSKYQEAVSIEAEALKYISSINLETIQDPVYKKLVEGLLKAKISNHDKALQTRQIITSGKVRNILDKIQKLGENKFNSVQVAALKRIVKIPYDYIKMNDAQEADGLVKSLREDINRNSRAYFSETLKVAPNFESMDITERFSYEQNKRLDNMMKSTKILPS